MTVWAWVCRLRGFEPRLIPEPLRPRVRDFGRQEVPQEILFRLVIAAEDARRGVLTNPAGHQRHDRLLSMRHDEARVREEAFRLGPALLVRPAEIELRHLVLLVRRDHGDHERLAPGTTDLHWQVADRVAPRHLAVQA